jgi:hypothetical protein
MIVWAIHNGGYDQETWYWGALASVAGLAATVVVLGRGRLRLQRGGMIALGLFGLYTAWSYLSIAWAQSPGDALAGSNKTLLYLALFALLLMLPWTARGALVVLTVFAVGIGVVGIVLLFRLASEDRVSALVIEGRLAAPTGYFNSTAALFTIDALMAGLLATRREIPGLIRGLLLAFACSGLQLALIVQSRGWLFTLPIVAIVVILVAADRLRLVMVAIIPLIGAAVPIRRLLDVYQSSNGAGLSHAAGRAGQAALVACAVVFVLGTLGAWADSLLPGYSLSRARRRLVGGVLTTVAVVGACAAFAVLTHGHPFRFISRQWNGFSQPESVYSSHSHFADVGSNRYDFWRVSLDALLAHPVGGLGQDNFADYYVVHRHTAAEPSATHSIELRLLAQTGIVGFVVFVGFLIVALRLAIRGRRSPDSLTRGVAAAALIPLVVWLIHGSIDWFWEMPSLSGPALGGLAMAASLGLGRASGRSPAGAGANGSAVARGTAGTGGSGAAGWGRTGGTGSGRSLAGPLAGGLALLAVTFVLGACYLSVREVSLASDVRFTDPAAALSDLSTAASLNPLSAVPARLAGTIALQNGHFAVAEQRFRQSIDRERGGWFAWLGEGLAASGLGQRDRAHRDFEAALKINHRQPAIGQALQRVYTKTPLTSAQAFTLLVLIQ